MQLRVGCFSFKPPELTFEGGQDKYELAEAIVLRRNRRPRDSYISPTISNRRSLNSGETVPYSTVYFLIIGLDFDRTASATGDGIELNQLFREPYSQNIPALEPRVRSELPRDKFAGVFCQ